VQLIDKVQDKGTFVLGSCNLGKGEAGKHFADELESLSGNRITFLLNRALNRNDQIYKPPYQQYGYQIGGSESFNNNNSSYRYFRNSWLGINQNGLFYFNNVWINRDSGDPVEIVK